MLPDPLLVFRRGSHRVKFLPLIDVDQKAIGSFRRGVEAVADDAGELVRVAKAIGSGLPFQIAIDRGRAGIVGRAPEGGGERAQGRRARAQRDHIPHRGAALLSQRRKEPGEHQRGLAAARWADDGDETMFPHPRAQFADRVIPAAEKRRVLFAERLQSTVRADRRPHGRSGDCLAAQRSAKGGEIVGLLKDARAFAEVDPGKKLQEPSRRRIAAGHRDRNHRECGVAGLPDQRELALILLGVAEPMRADQDGAGLGSSDRVLERRHPPQARAKLSAVEEGAEALGAEPSVQLRGGGAVAAGVAQENIVVAVAPHAASLALAGRRSIPLIRPGDNQPPASAGIEKSLVAQFSPTNPFRTSESCAMTVTKGSNRSVPRAGTGTGGREQARGFASRSP